MGHLIDRLLNEWRMVAIVALWCAGTALLTACTRAEIRTASEVPLQACEVILEQAPESKAASVCRTALLAAALAGVVLP